MKNKKTMKIQLFGVVQGVGMRYFIYRSAKSYNLNGVVRNLFDGSVECIVQGEEDVLDMFLKHIKKESPGDINTVNKEFVDDSKEYVSFNITY